ncbi:DUF4352 domain-containing protein [Streptomonospora algeriensis]|uniref:DUF4352 domain-containing protein n=1 Tax=Streptomonospora algeriensis TaxID=995084 RepID=A0ABW3BAA6_9ACTN
MYAQQPPPAAPAQKKGKGWLYGCLGCGGLAVLVLVVGIAATVAGSGGSGSDGSSVEASGEGGSGGGEGGGQEEETAGIGETVESGAFAFTVTEVEGGVRSVGDNPYLTETPDGEYVIVHVTVENIGDEAGLFESSSQKLVDADGKQYSTDSAAQISVDSDSWIDEINPGNSVEGQLIFDVPPEAEPSHVELHDFLSLDQGAKVALS